MPSDPRLFHDRFPRSSKYHPEWLLSGVSGAANPLWMTEWLSTAMDLRPGMRVLDLGCGRALSSIFLRREFDVQVWATDLWFAASENWQRIRDADVDDGVFPIQSDARNLPFASGFFDAIVSIDSYFYYGTDDTFLANLGRFLKPGGQLGIAGAGILHEFDDGIPPVLQAWWTQDMSCLHSAEWWQRHWKRSKILDVEVADTLPRGWELWLEWLRLIAPDNHLEIEALKADAGKSLGYVRAVGRRRSDINLVPPTTSIPTTYIQKPLLRS